LFYAAFAVLNTLKTPEKLYEIVETAQKVTGKKVRYYIVYPACQKQGQGPGSRPGVL